MAWSAALVAGHPVRCTGKAEYGCARFDRMTDAMRQASEALSESELLFGEGLTEVDVEALTFVKSALSAAILAESPQTTLSPLHSGNMPSRYCLLALSVSRSAEAVRQR